VLDVPAGTYTGPFAINKSLTINGAGQDAVFIQTADLSADVIKICYSGPETEGDACDVTIQNVTVRTGRYGIYSKSTGSINILNNTFYNNGYDGTELPDPDSGTAQADYSDFYNNSGHCSSGGAMRIRNATSSEIANNTVYDNLRGIRFQDSHNGNIHDNLSYDNFESGIFKIDSNNSVELYAMGVRNSFGLAIDPITQNLWETENGEGTYDEINMIYGKFNGGWALNIGPSYRSDSEISNNLDRINDSEFQDYSYSDPKFSWYDTVGPTAISFPNFISFEKYKDWLFVGSANFGEIYKFQLDVERDDFIFYDTNLSKDLVLDLKDSSNEIIFATIPGIITDIKFNDDGMYVVHYSDGIIYRIYPKEFDSTKTLAIISEDKIDDKEKELIASLEGLDFFTLISQGKIIEASDSLYSFIERNYYAMLNYLFS